MTARSDIRAALQTAGPVPTGKRRWIIVGMSAAQSLAVHGWDGITRTDWTAAIPKRLDGFPIVTTDEFSGWTIVDRPRLEGITELARLT